MLKELFTLAHVPRWGIVEMSKPQTVAEHTFKTMAIARQLGKAVITVSDKKFDWGYLYNNALLHDIGEAMSGDIPMPCKRALKKEYDEAGLSVPEVLKPMAIPETNGPYFIEESITVIADTVEALIYAHRYMMGSAVERLHMYNYIKRSIEKKEAAFMQHVPQKVVRVVCEEVTKIIQEMTYTNYG